MLRTLLLEPVFNVLLVLYALIPGNDFGVAVIALTVIIRLLMWPLVRKQVKHQQVMRELQPKIEKLKKKYKDDKQKQSEKMLELFKKQDVNPFAPFGILLVQMPILITLFFVLREIVEGDTIATTAYGFVQDLPMVQAIIADSSLFEPYLFGVINMAEPSVVLAVLAGGAQYIQAKQMQANSQSTQKQNSPAADIQRNMVKILPFVMIGVGLFLPSALPLYWAVGSMVAIVQQHIITQELNLPQLIGLQPKPAAEAPQTSAKPRAKDNKGKTSEAKTPSQSAQNKKGKSESNTKKPQKNQQSQSKSAKNSKSAKGASTNRSATAKQATAKGKG